MYISRPKTHRRDTHVHAPSVSRRRCISSTHSHISRVVIESTACCAVTGTAPRSPRSPRPPPPRPPLSAPVLSHSPRRAPSRRREAPQFAIRARAVSLFFFERDTRLERGSAARRRRRRPHRSQPARVFFSRGKRAVSRAAAAAPLALSLSLRLASEDPNPRHRRRVICVRGVRVRAWSCLRS